MWFINARLQCPKSSPGLFLGSVSFLWGLFHIFSESDFWLAAGNTCFINAALQCLRSSPGLPQQLVPDLAAQSAYCHRLLAASPTASCMPPMESSAPVASEIPPTVGPSAVQPSEAAPGGLVAEPSDRVSMLWVLAHLAT